MPERSTPTSLALDEDSILATPFNLWKACRDGDANEVRRLLELGADPQRPPGPLDAPYDAPILRASQAKVGSAACVKALLDFGADPDARDKSGSTPAMNAARRGDAELLAVLAPVADLDAKNYAGMTPLIWAAAFGGEGWTGCFDILLDKADPKACRRDGATALTMAAQLGRRAMVERLIAGSDLGARAGGLTAAEAAAHSGHPELAALLEAAELAGAASPGAAPKTGRRI